MKRAALNGMKARGEAFAKDEEGALIIFGVMIFGLMLAIGGLSFDLMRYEMHRERLQSVLDRAVLAAASLSQTLDPEEVVEEYFAKAGMANFLDEVDVVEGLSSRTVTADASINVPLHHGNFAIYGGVQGETDTLIAEATATAQESIGNVEISMVLDISGSMNSYSRLANLKIAAADFVNTVYGAAEPGTVSTSIIPYATQVNAGDLLLSHYNVQGATHDYSHCINFQSADFDSPALSTTQSLEQTLHFDPWTDEHDNFDWTDDDLPSPVCPTESSRSVLPWSDSSAELISHINGLTATGNTSTDIGVKWGAALLDPGSQSVLSSMVASNDVSDDLDGRPYAYDTTDAMKILVVMTDGNHTSQYYMDDYRDGDSRTWMKGGRRSVWSGDGSTPVVSNGWWTNKEFYRFNHNKWKNNPYSNEDSTRMSWVDLWAEIPVEAFTDDVLKDMDASSSYRNDIEDSIRSVGQSTKDSRLSSLCEEVKDENVIVFTVGLEVSTHSGNLLEACASTVSHYYDVTNLDIQQAFQSIATQINQLRLTQ